MVQQLNKRDIVRELLEKLNAVYDNEAVVIKQIKQLMSVLNQLQEDKEMLQTAIMYQSNKLHRKEKWSFRKY